MVLRLVLDGEKGADEHIMDWIKSFQKSIDYIEEHITEPMQIEDIAAQMNISTFYYQKIFLILCGFTVGEYIRKRRLTLAGCELIATDEKIIDIAMKYGYDTPEGFSRAFVRFHGLTPSAVRKGGNVKSFAKLAVEISLKGGSVMNYKIVKKEAFKIIAKQQRCEKIKDIRGRVDIPEFWNECHDDGTIDFLIKSCKKDGVLGKSLVGMCMEDSVSAKDFPYFIGAEYSCGEIPSGYNIVEVPAMEYAVFVVESIGIDDIATAIQQMWHKIFAEFFPSSNYKPKGNFDLEVYPSDRYKCELWISVENK